MKIIGRIILLVVGVLILVTAVPTIINTYQALSASGWQNLFNAEGISLLGRFLGQCVNALFGIIALWGCISGHKSLKLALCAIILLISPITTIVADVNSGVTFDFQRILYYISSFGLPFAYAFGFLLV
ncbi:MAG: hypothetical protein J6A47_08795 [Bacilli bacterium]|nr:hypothetical protein [Bacilli bacterium]MBO6285181.1 hypothetical protein [Bacilli bacterium]